MNDWRSYDDVAETYQRIHAPRFADAARDLVGALEIRDGQRVLDVGTGTGAAADEVARTGASVVGISGMRSGGRRRRSVTRSTSPKSINVSSCIARGPACGKRSRPI